MRRVRARVEGTVQGVGFRPFVYRLASELSLAGFVLNDERGVLLEVEGEDREVDGFLRRLAEEAPPLATIEAVRPSEVAPAGEHGFRILASPHGGEPEALVSPDTATCDDCLAELFDPADRRYRYPFVNCTNCGPRFTIVRGVPYDRPFTTMAGFELCPRCAAEYEDPADRRFHAQPNACPECGPTLRLLPPDLYGDEALREAVAALREGAVVAVKGIGGFHLACLAAREPAVAALRARKHREDKPFAIMVRDVEAARALVSLTGEEAALLAGRDRPIVLAPRRPGAPVAASVAPRSADLGVLLPYSPLHHLLLADVGEPLVMTSGNVSDEPIAHEDDDALARLEGIADLLLFHDRPIHTRTDDSVLRALPDRRPLLMRRSRGFVPDALALPVEARPLLACGAELKSTFCVAKGTRAWVSHHVGDLKSYEVLQAYEAGIEHFERLFAVAPEVVVHDEHPDYLSTRAALARGGVEAVAVQHHHAHLAACLAEHGETGPAAGAIYDGSGLGRDGAVWGGELLVGDLRDFERAGHLWPVRLPGGDRAVRPAVADGGGLAARGGLGRAAARAGPAAVRAGRRTRPHRRLLAVDDEHGALVRRGRRAVRAARRGDLRGAGGDRARSRGRRGRARRLRDARARRAADDPGRRRGPRGEAWTRRSSPPASTMRSLARRRSGVHGGPGGAVGRRVPESDPAHRHSRRARGGGPPRARPRAPPAQRRRHLVRPGGGGGGETVIRLHIGGQLQTRLGLCLNAGVRARARGLPRAHHGSVCVSGRRLLP